MTMTRIPPIASSPRRPCELTLVTADATLIDAKPCPILANR